MPSFEKLMKDCGIKDKLKEYSCTTQTGRDQCTLDLDFNGHHLKVIVHRNGHKNYTCDLDKGRFKKTFPASKHHYEQSKNAFLEFGKKCIQDVRKK